MQTKETTGIHIEGHLKIFDPESKEIYVNKRNAIHYENMSIALAQSLSNSVEGGFINASLYNQTYSKVVNPTSSTNTDPTRNFTETRHTTGNNYTDVFVSCLLDYGEPANQTAFDTTNSTNSVYTFDELGLVSFSNSGNSMLLTHVIFHPVLKSLNRLIQIDYTVRIQSLTGLVGV